MGRADVCKRGVLALGSSHCIPRFLWGLGSPWPLFGKGPVVFAGGFRQLGEAESCCQRETQRGDVELLEKEAQPGLGSRKLVE